MRLKGDSMAKKDEDEEELDEEEEGRGFESRRVHYSP